MTFGNTVSISQEDLQFHMKADSFVTFAPPNCIMFSKIFASARENISA